jgi:hypothetical protein
MPNPEFYKIDCEREVVLQGKSSFYVTIARNDSVMHPSETLCVILYPQPNTFETHYTLSANMNTGSPIGNITFPLTPAVDPNFTIISNNLYLKNYQNLPFTPAGPVKVLNIDAVNNQIIFDKNWNGVGTLGQPFTVGEYVEDGGEWNINCVDSKIQSNYIYSNTLSNYGVDGTVPNPFDGTTVAVSTIQTGTGYVPRNSQLRWIRISNDTDNNNTRSATIRVDYEGTTESHLKFNILIAKLNTVNSSVLEALVATNSAANFGIKSASPTSDSIDYQEIHFFGYPESYTRPSRVIDSLEYQIENPIYEDRSSFGLLKTNPRLSGNVKITTDSNGDIWLNSFDANEELAKAEYKRFFISSNSTYQKDLYTFFKEGKTPTDVVFDVYEYDNQYLNNKTVYNQQFDNFYNYGVEQLKSKFYPENYTFLAPLWTRRVLPEFFIILRVNHPIDPKTYETNYTNSEAFTEYFKEARIIKTFDMRASSKLGNYIRNIVNDSRYRERPLEISWDKDTASYWNGIAYQKATITNKGEYLYDFLTEDRPIKEFEEYITNGFQRNGIISTNLLNLEFLFDDDEADLYSINRYIGFYVTENQLAEFEIEPRVLGKIAGQSPLPKPGVDGEPYSLRSFIQTNPNGIELPVNYYHSTSFTNNTSNIPDYQGFVIGKFPLPTMVDDPLRLFYVKDRDDVFKRIIGLSENDYGYPGTEDYVRATQLQLFDNSEDISKYTGVNDIVSQFPASLLGSGNSQLRVHLLDNSGTGVFANDEEIEIKVIKYNDPGRKNTYHIQVVATTATSVTVHFLLNQDTDQETAGFTQPAIGSTVTISVADSSIYDVNQNIFIISGGYYRINSIVSPTQLSIINLGGPQNAAPSTVFPAGCLIGVSLSGAVVYNINPLDYYLNVDNYLTLNLLSFGSYNVNDAWRIEVDYPSIQKYELSIVPGSQIDAFYKPAYEQFTWKMIANGVGLPAGDAWDYPQYDPNGYEYLSQFSNEGTPEQVAKALALCINTFDNAPVIAWADGRVIYLKSKLQYEEGNSILFKRKMLGNSVFENLGFYENANIDRQTNIEVVNYRSGIPITYSILNLDPQIIDEPSTPITSLSYYVSINRGTFNTYIFVRSEVNATTYATAIVSGNAPFYTITIPTNNERYFDPRLPFSLDLSNVPIGTYIEQVYTMSTANTVEQFFVGGVKRLRNRASIGITDGEKYYQNRQIKISGTITTGSNVVNLITSGIYIGATVTGTGVPNNTVVVDVKSTSIVISNAATSTGTFDLTIGTISILNDTVIYQQWYQCLKQMYRRMKGWDVQGKLVYSLPYLEEPTFDVNEYLNGFTDYASKSIIQLDDDTQEFFYSIDNRVVAYRVFRPTFGIFSIYPIKQFDFDFFLSDYSYTPTIEAFKYFLDETIFDGQTVELDLFQNYQLVQSSSSNYELAIEAYEASSGNWYQVEELTITTLDSTNPWILLNTFYPLYDYDVNEYPYNTQTVPPGAFVLGMQYRAAGKRNYDRRYIYKPDGSKLYPSKFRIKYFPTTASDSLKIVNYNYSVDRDITTFTGFAGLQDITSIGDADVIQKLKDDGKFIESYTYQLLLSEYDRLRENYTKEWAVKSKVVPYVTKWVNEGTDARDNYYRLNNSMAFGISNLSPADNVDFVETAVLTQEFPYLDSTPQGYPNDSMSSSRSYQFARLIDIAAKNRTWYDLMTNDTGNDWFTKYFSIGYPTELDTDKFLIKRGREERFTFFTYNNGVGQSQTIFRGGKIQPISFDVTLPNLPEISNNTEYEGYKFSAIARIEPYDFYTRQGPVSIEVHRNKKYKTIAIIITIRIQDYRTQSGGAEYMLQYFMNDLLTNENQQQFKLDLTSPSATSLSLRNFYPYNTAPTGSAYTNTAVLRPRQGFLGGGYLRLGNKKLGGIVLDQTGISPLLIPSPQRISIGFINSVPFFQFNALQEIFPIQNFYRVDPGLYAIDTTTVPITAVDYGNDGFTFNFNTTYNNSSVQYALVSYVDNQKVGNTIEGLRIKIGSGNNTTVFYANVVPAFATSGTSSASPSSNVPCNIPGYPEVETYHIEGGTQGFQNIKTLLTFGNLIKLFNTKNAVIEYFDVTDTGSTVTNEYILKFIGPDTIIKKNVLNFSIDEDKPDEYSTVEYIGYNTVNTKGQEYMVRHRGFYEPKTREVLSFWVRENSDLSRHYEKDFLLSNTHIDNVSETAGLIRNYGINKVSTVGNILQIARTSAYKSVYPLINEVAVTAQNFLALNSSWDNNFYRNYTSTSLYTNVPGISDMLEYKTFLASKAMNVPKSFDFDVFTDTEVTFELINPSLAVGVGILAGDNSAINQSRPDANRPKLIITIDLRSRLLRELLEQINAITTDEFERLQIIAPGTILANLTNAEIDDLKRSYFEKNILDLYETAVLSLYAKNQEGIDLLNLNLSAAAKAAGRYKIDKDCTVKQLDNLRYEITKILDPKIASGFSIAATVQRI